MSFNSEEISRPKGRLAPNNLGSSYLLSAGYDGDSQKAYVRLYEPKSQEIYLWYDNTYHLPYLITKDTPEEVRKNNRVINHNGLLNLEQVKKYDALLNEDIEVTKVVAQDPLSIGGRGNSIRNYLQYVWESRIRYYSCYMYDRSLIPGMPYKVVEGDLIPEKYELPADLAEQFKKILGQTEEYLKEPMKEWARLLSYPVPDIKRVAVDIEVRGAVENRMPSADEARDPIVAVAFYSSDGLNRVIVLNEADAKQKREVIQGGEMLVYEDEKAIIEETIGIIDAYPVVLTFNGDDFDLKYLHNRANKLGITKDNIPITLGRRFAFLRNGVHIDLYQFFRNMSIKGYAFRDVYRENNLDDISRSILGIGKIQIDDFFKLTHREMAEYCLQDAYITYLLTSFNNDMVMDLIVLLTRIGRMIMEDITRLGVSRWILSLMEWQHRKQEWLIPNTEDIIKTKGTTTTEAIIKGKKYQGAIVRDPRPGVHFDVTVLDFASLYPSAIKNWNLSYETLLCPHDECKKNYVPGTSHWFCTRKHGMTSTLIGSLRDVRVLWYKPLSKDKSLTDNQRHYYDVVQQALKVFLNASYGVFGAESFPLYCPPLAESTAAVGRYALNEAIEESNRLGIDVLYGDTDSIFLAHPSIEQIDALVNWASKKLAIDLEVEKTYRYAIFSKRKKNYLGVYKDGRLDIKGLTGKKRHIPPLLKEAFDELTMILSNIQNPEEIEDAKRKIGALVENVHKRLENRDFNIEDVAFSMMMGKSLSHYDTNPQHVKAAKMLEERGMEIKAGDIISYVVTKDDVKPSIMANPRDIDIKKYTEYLESTFEQLLDALEMSFNELVGRPQQTSLGFFFGTRK